MDRAKRMQAKALLCTGGIVLLFIAACGSLMERISDKGGEPSREPVVEVFRNVYVVEAGEDHISVFDGAVKSFLLRAAGDEAAGGAAGCAAGQIVDLTVTDGVVSGLHIKDAGRVNGKVVKVAPGEGVELENMGFLKFDADVRFFMLYGTLREGTAGDIRIGYDFADFVVEDGRVCAVLMTRDETMDYIRVLIKNSDYAGAYHEKVSLSCDADYEVYCKETQIESHAAGERIDITADSPYFSEEENRIYIVPSARTARISLESISRSQGTPSYRGTVEIVRTSEGLAVINEVLLEEYLYGVVPSEMPSGYPLEALKAQAVCARTYAYAHMLVPGLPDIGAHVDDSTGYQVYNNIPEQSATTTAVKETAGQMLYYEGQPVSTYYYSTSCGFGSDEHAWKSESATELPYLTALSISRDGLEGKESIYTAQSMREEAMFAQFLDYPPETDYERDEPWYRWTYEVGTLSHAHILEVLRSRFRANAGLILTLEGGEFVSKEPKELGKIRAISILSRNEGGAADELLVEGEDASYKVISELNIRYVLCDGEAQVTRRDGSSVEMKSLLPSAFFIIFPIQEEENMVGYKLYGGGFGHGAGMSQNGAKNMAQAGLDAQQILEFFYRGSLVQGVEQK